VVVRPAADPPRYADEERGCSIIVLIGHEEEEARWTAPEASLPASAYRQVSLLMAAAAGLP